VVWREDFGETLSEDQAEAEAKRLLFFFKELAQAFAPRTKEDKRDVN
jgi:hypothetical protein